MLLFGCLCVYIQSCQKYQVVVVCAVEELSDVRSCLLLISLLYVYIYMQLPDVRNRVLWCCLVWCVYAVTELPDVGVRMVSMVFINTELFEVVSVEVRYVFNMCTL